MPRIVIMRGLSPRVRGKRALGMALSALEGSIPACAGETPAGRPAPSWATGLSPRVRGKRALSVALSALEGSIPACAGETYDAGRHR